MRAKSIKNKARVNAEMSPAELKALLKKTVTELASVREHAASLEEEVKIWRSGGQVDKSDWAGSAPSNGTSASLARKLMSPTPATPGSSSAISRAGTPGGLMGSAVDSRPETPYGSVSSADEREEFLRRENDLSDQLAERVS
jgi:kinesin family protein 5